LKEPVRISDSHLFPTLILDRLVNLLEILNTPKSVQKHLDYDHLEMSYPNNLCIILSLQKIPETVQQT
jgi:hypothetical protein